MTIPSQKGYVNDTAEMLSPHTCGYLNGVLADLEQQSTHQVMVLTIASLKGENLEAYALKVAQQWGIGQKEADNGVLLLIVRKERKIRIEVGYGLEGVLTDLTAGRIIRNVIAPQFKNGRYDRGVTNGVTAIIDTVQGEPINQDHSGSGFHEPYLIPSIVIGMLICTVFIVLLFKDNVFSPAAAGGIFVPFAAMFILNPSMLLVLILSAAGFMAGLVFSLIRRRIMSKKGRYAEYRITPCDDHDDSSFGGTGISIGGSSSGSSGGGSSSGGGGSFGGGGASGGW